MGNMLDNPRCHSKTWEMLPTRWASTHGKISSRSLRIVAMFPVGKHPWIKSYHPTAIAVFQRNPHRNPLVLKQPTDWLATNPRVFC